MNTSMNSRQSLAKQKIKQLSRHHSEYNSLEFQLRLSLNSVTSSVLRAFSLSTVEEINEFEFRHNDKTMITCWIDAAKLQEENSLENIIINGFTIPEYGLRLSTGAIQLAVKENKKQELEQDNLDPFSQDYNNVNQENTSENGLMGSRKKEYVPKRVYKLVRLRVCVGRSFVVEPKEGPIVVPNGYDSLYIRPTNDSPVYNHRYVVFDPLKIIPDYLVYVEYSPDGDQLLLDQRHLSHSLTRQDAHNQSILNEAYQRVIDQLEHRGYQEQQEFDNFNDEQTELNGQYPEFGDLPDLVDQLDTKRISICENAAAVEQQLRAIFKRALLQLHDITQLKMSSLLSTRVELLRSMEEIKWMEDFLHYQKDLVDPMTFLETYSKFESMKNEKLDMMQRYPSTQARTDLMNVQDDILAEGHMQVTSSTGNIDDSMRQSRKTVLINPNSQKEFDQPASGLLFDENELISSTKQDNCRVS